MPGMIIPPLASMVRGAEYAAAKSFEPTATILLPLMTTTPASMISLSAFIVRTVPFLMITSADFVFSVLNPHIQSSDKARINFLKTFLYLFWFGYRSVAYSALGRGIWADTSVLQACNSAFSSSALSGSVCDRSFCSLSLAKVE